MTILTETTEIIKAGEVIKAELEGGVASSGWPDAALTDLSYVCMMIGQATACRDLAVHIKVDSRKKGDSYANGSMQKLLKKGIELQLYEFKRFLREKGRLAKLETPAF